MNRYTGPCPCLTCDRVFINANMRVVARHLKQDWDLPVLDVDWTEMVIESQHKNGIDAMPDML